MAAAEEIVEEVIKPSHRFVLPDISACGDWLIARLAKRYGGLTPQTALGWLRGMMESPEFLFLRNDKAVFLGQSRHTRLDPTPICEEVFCLAQEGGQRHAAALYKDFLRWAEAQQARELIVDGFSDVPKPLITEMLGEKLASRTVWHVRLR